MDRESAAKTATARATEAIEAAEMMFADEMGATLDLSPAARTALIEKIATVIQTAVAEERQKAPRPPLAARSLRPELPSVGAAHLFEARWQAVLKIRRFLNGRSSF